ncbi:hypothetical protein HB976_02145 [Yersinia mollaretii]|nr:hypothetical protein [Yersinia mollaretii]
MHESIFDFDAEIVSYACRAGISVDSSDLTGKEAGQKQSPAQKMANTWDVKVEAFEMRSSYVGIYGTGEEIRLATNYGSIIKEYENSIDNYEEEKAKGNKNIKPPKKPENYEENVKRSVDVKERAKNEKKGGPIAPNGAWRFPKTGDTPVGLKKGLQSYQPVEWTK